LEDQQYRQEPEDLPSVTNPKNENCSSGHGETAAAFLRQQNELKQQFQSRFKQRMCAGSTK